MDTSLDMIPAYDASRVAAQIVSGIGFLGAGVIFVNNNSVSGLTTAAGIWAAAGVGMAIGAGAYYVGCGSSVITELFHYFNEEKIKVLNVKASKSKDSAKVELDLLYPAGYAKNDLIIKWSNDKRIESING